jgi:hypothetical protein
MRREGNGPKLLLARGSQHHTERMAPTAFQAEKKIKTTAARPNFNIARPKSMVH